MAVTYWSPLRWKRGFPRYKPSDPANDAVRYSRIRNYTIRQAYELVHSDTTREACELLDAAHAKCQKRSHTHTHTHRQACCKVTYLHQLNSSWRLEHPGYRAAQGYEYHPDDGDGTHLSKLRSTFTLHGAISQKAVVFTVAAVRTWNLHYCLLNLPVPQFRSFFLKKGFQYHEIIVKSNM
jgi:hypothetical protein